ncbi:PLAC8-domain-containing protein [Athelia psychrophila]|uniref:PLAC8-domain-containing protein n=1 Tax=Athelia psychrophila TaxID=1759441 RepID=A0A166AB00_9AGAM|nr:PLAC8-domain-containing protein [Fibularhizoctonia sp. CBS 109695]
MFALPERDWTHGLMACFADCGTCCLATWCPCFVFGQISKRRKYLEKNGLPDPEYGGTGCGMDCCNFHGGQPCMLSWICQMGGRSHVRKRYNIRGTGCGDCVTSCCCYPCGLTQESRELDAEETALAGGRR